MWNIIIYFQNECVEILELIITLSSFGNKTNFPANDQHNLLRDTQIRWPIIYTGTTGPSNNGWPGTTKPYIS